jgi:ubiquinol-cytochrome c reductase cytochrome b subunit
MTNSRPTNGVIAWIDYRLPIFTLLRRELYEYPTPRNLNYLWNFGSLLGITLAILIVTGIVLAMHYTPTVDGAFKSVEHVMRDVNYGWLIRYVHTTGASMFFVAVYVHIFRGLYYGSYKAPRELLWGLGVFILLLMMATAFFGYTLPWGQMSFWGATVITNLFSAIPVIGNSIVIWLWGGFSVAEPTLHRFYALHYLLPFVIVGFVGLHLIALHQFGSNNSLGTDTKETPDTIPFHPYFTVKDLFGLAVFLVVYAWFVFYEPGVLLNPDNAIPANPAVTPAHIVPEWYLLPYYAMLRAIPNKLLGILAMFGSIFVLFLLPWLDRSPVRSGRLAQGIAQVAKGTEVPTEAKYEMEDGKLMLSVYTSAKGFDTAAEDNSFNEYGGDAAAATWAPKKEVFADLKHIARSAQYHTLLSMTRMTIPAIIQKASPQGTVFSVKEKVRNGKPVFEVMTAQGNTAKTTYYDLVTGEPAGG